MQLSNIFLPFILCINSKCNMFYAKKWFWVHMKCYTMVISNILTGCKIHVSHWVPDNRIWRKITNLYNFGHFIEYRCLRDLKTWEWIAAFEHSENLSIGSNIMVDHTFKNYFRFFGCNISLQIVQISSKGHLKVNGRRHLMQLVC